MSSISSIELAVVIGLSVVLLCQLLYWAVFMFRVRKRARYLANQLPGISIVVCARNEAENLEKLIPALVAQKYAAPKQIVVVDDGSTDDTPMTLAVLRQKYPELYTTTIPIDNKFSHGKKLALTVGIKAARYEHIVFTDADCIPASEHWLTNIVERYANPDKQLVIGYGRYAKHPGLLNLFIRYETFWNAVQYMGVAVALKPFMGVGRNLSYTKTLFNNSSQFRHTMTILSGDDDLFVCEMGKRKNTAIVFEYESQTISEPKRTWMEYVAQKSRHLTTAPLYPSIVKFVLVSEQFTRFFFWLFGIVAFVLAFYLPSTVILYSVIIAFAARFITIYTALGIAANNMHESRMWLLALPMDIIIPLMQAMAWITGILTQRRNTWK